MIKADVDEMMDGWLAEVGAVISSELEKDPAPLIHRVKDLYEAWIRLEGKDPAEAMMLTMESVRVELDKYGVKPPPFTIMDGRHR